MRWDIVWEATKEAIRARDPALADTLKPDWKQPDAGLEAFLREHFPFIDWSRQLIHETPALIRNYPKGE